MHGLNIKQRRCISCSRMSHVSKKKSRNDQEPRGQARPAKQITKKTNELKTNQNVGYHKQTKICKSRNEEYLKQHKRCTRRSNYQ